MSNYKNKSIEFLLQKLNELKGSEITIEKKERDDLDMNKLVLDNVEIVNQLHDIDDYVDLQTVELQGKGSVITSDGKRMKLPLDSYELPIHQLHSVEASGELLTIITDRATYSIKK